MIKLINFSRNESIEFDNKNYNLSEKDFGTVNITLATSQGYKQIGQSVNTRTFGNRTVSLVGYVLANDEAIMNTKKNALRRVVSLTTPFRVDNGNYFMELVATSSISFAKSYTENNKFLCKFMIEAVAPYPFFQKNTGMEKEITPSAQTVIINNDGDVPIGVKINFKWYDKSLQPKNPYIINQTTGERIQATHTFGMWWYENFFIDTTYGNKHAKVINTSLGNVVIDNALPLLSDDSVLFYLQPGKNTITIGAQTNGNGLGAVIDYSPAYSEV